jgi:soluble lytic murein transglycosylase-like protein
VNRTRTSSEVRLHAATPGFVILKESRRAMKLVLRFCLAAIPAVIPAAGGEFAVLGTGFRIHAESHEQAGGLVRLHTGDGDIEIPASSISRFEADDYVPPPVAPPAARDSPPPADPKTLANMAADAAGLPRALVHSVVRAESAWQVDAVSPKGAIGLMQLMPGTAAAMKADPRDPAQNVAAGAMYLRELLLKYQNSDHQVSDALAAYNAGPAAVDKYKGVPPYAETRAYIQRVVSQYDKESGQKAPDEAGADH